MQQSLHETVHVQSNTAGRILVVEDDDALSHALTRILVVEGYEVVETHDYRDALPILEDGGPVDLLLSDLRLPGVNGFALARMGRMRHHDLKVVYMTAYDDDFPAHEALGPVMRKPIDQDILLRTVRKILSSV
jgi:two-component system, cell cycle sensor histidine kinase and response regulator CckA